MTDELKEKAKKLNRLADLEVFTIEVEQANREFYRLPPWVQAEMEGDYSPWDAGMWSEEINKEEA